MPASAEPGAGYTFLTSVSAKEVTAVIGGRSGRSYPLEPERWLAYACHVAGRSLTEDEWTSYLGDRPYQPTCNGLGSPGRQPEAHPALTSATVAARRSRGVPDVRSCRTP